MSSKVMSLLSVVVLAAVVIDSGITGVKAATPAANDPCTSALQGVTACLDFATGKSATPTSQCCKAVSDIREKNPVCLCKFIVETHNGSPQIKSLGIQEDKLTKLPAACKLADAKITECPKLLDVPADSPTGSIFTSNSTTSATTPASGSSSSTSASTSAPTNGANDGFKNNRIFPAALIAVSIMVVAFFFN